MGGKQPVVSCVNCFVLKFDLAPDFFLMFTLIFSTFSVDLPIEWSRWNTLPVPHRRTMGSIATSVQCLWEGRRMNRCWRLSIRNSHLRLWRWVERTTVFQYLYRYWTLKHKSCIRNFIYNCDLSGEHVVLSVENSRFIGKSVVHKRFVL
jgi:hypothetical protein